MTAILTQKFTPEEIGARACARALAKNLERLREGEFQEPIPVTLPHPETPALEAALKRHFPTARVHASHRDEPPSWVGWIRLRGERREFGFGVLDGGEPETLAEMIATTCRETRASPGQFGSNAPPVSFGWTARLDFLQSRATGRIAP